MKNIIYGVITLLVTTLIVLAVITITGQMNRKVEVDDMLEQNVRSAVENTLEQKSYTINDRDEFVANLIQNMHTIENDSDIIVKIRKVDYEKGLVMITVEEHFNNPIGNESVTSVDTVVEIDKSVDKTLANVTFYDKTGEMLSMKSMTVGETIKEPNVEGKNIKGWQIKDTDTVVERNADGTVGIVGGDVVYVAV